SVNALSGPWDDSLPGNLVYDNGVHLPPTILAVNPGDDIVITYLSGLTSAFSDLPPTVDALGYVGGIFGSGADCAGSPCTGVGATGHHFPSFLVDPSNTGTQIALNALIGDFVDSSGTVLAAFATGDGPFSITAPAGTVALQLGINDDFFSDNTGALSIAVSVSTAVPEPASFAMIFVGLGGLGFAMRNARRKSAVVVAC